MTALVRAEFVKGLRRTRTLVIVIGLIALPTVITLAIHARAHRAEPAGEEGLFRLARQSGLVVPAAVLLTMSGFLLVVVAGMIAGDAVAGDAASGNLRYLLVRPVARARLLAAKAVVSAVLICAVTMLVALAGLAAGVALFGWRGISVPAAGALALGFHLSTTTLLVRVAVATAYVAFGFTALLALGLFFSTLTDSPAGAIGATVGVYIVSEILDAIGELGVVRYGFPTHYQDAWRAVFTANRYPADMAVGLIVQVAYLVVFGGLALWWFGRKDIRS